MESVFSLSYAFFYISPLCFGVFSYPLSKGRSSPLKMLRSGRYLALVIIFILSTIRSVLSTKLYFSFNVRKVVLRFTPISWYAPSPSFSSSTCVANSKYLSIFSRPSSRVPNPLKNPSKRRTLMRNWLLRWNITYEYDSTFDSYVGIMSDSLSFSFILFLNFNRF